MNWDGKTMLHLNGHNRPSQRIKQLDQYGSADYNQAELWIMGLTFRKNMCLGVNEFWELSNSFPHLIGSVLISMDSFLNGPDCPKPNSYSRFSGRLHGGVLSHHATQRGIT